MKSGIPGKIAAARATLAQGSDFRQSRVRRGESFEIEVFRQVVLVNDRECKKEIGVGPLAKDIRFVPQLTLKTDLGKSERVFVFLWSPALSHLRTMKIAYKTVAEKHTEVVAPAGDLYAEQTDEVMTEMVDGQIADAQGSAPQTDKAGFGGVLTRLRTIKSHKVKVGVSVEGGEDGEQCQDNDNERGEDEEEDEDEGDNQSEPEPEGEGETPAKKAKSVVMGGAISSSVLGNSRHSGRHAPSVRAPSVVEVRSNGGAAGAASVCGSGDGEDGLRRSSRRGMLADPDAEASKWIQKLDLAAAMGDSLGVQDNHAEKAMGKLAKNKDAEDAVRRLKRHLRLVELAKVLKPEAIWNHLEEELRAAINAMMQAKVELPLKVKMTLFTKAAKTEAERVDNFTSFEKLAEMSWFVNANNGETMQEFDPLAPNLALLDCSADEKVQLFVECVVKGCILKLITKGEHSAELLLKCLEKLLALCDKALVIMEIDPAISRIICELITVAKAFLAMQCPATCVSDLAGEELLDHLKNFHEAAGGASWILESVMLAAEEDTYWQERLAYLQSHNARILEERPAVQHTLSVLGDMVEGDIISQCLAIQGQLKSISKAVANLSEDIAASFSTQVMGHIDGTIKLTLQHSESGTATEQELKACSDLIAECQTTFPFAASLADGASQVGDALAACTQRGVMAGLVELLKRMKGDENILPMLGEVTAQVAALENVALHHDLEVSIDEMANYICKASVKTVGCAEFGELVEVMGRLASLMGKLGGVLQCAKGKSVLDKLLGLLHAKEELEKKASIDGALVLAKAASHTKLLGKMNAKVVEAQAACNAEAEDELHKFVMDGVRVALASIQKVLKDVGEHMVASAKAAVETVHTMLKDLKGGVKGGADWLAAATEKDKTDWKRLLEIASKTILKEPKVAKMKDPLNKLDKVPPLRVWGTRCFLPTCPRIHPQTDALCDALNLGPGCVQG